LSYGRSVARGDQRRVADGGAGAEIVGSAMAAPANAAAVGPAAGCGDVLVLGLRLWKDQRAVAWEVL